MLANLSKVWALFLALFVMLLGGGLQSTIISLFGERYQFSTTVIGLVMSSYYVGFLFGSILAPIFIKRVGFVRYFAAQVALASIAVMIYPIFTHEGAWLFARLLTGFCFAGIYVVAESWLNLSTHNDNRGQILSMYIVVLYAGLALSQFLLYFTVSNDYFLFVLSSLLISSASLPLLLSNQPTPTVDIYERVSIGYLYHASPFAVIGIFLSSFAVSTMLGLGALFANRIHMPNSLLAWFVAGGYLGCVLMQLPLGKLSDHMDRRLVVIGQCVLAALVSAVCLLITDFYYLIICFTVLGGLVMPIYAICSAHLNDRVANSKILAASATVIIISGIGSSLGPVIGGWLMQHVNVYSLFSSLSAVMVALAVFGVARLFMREARPEEGGGFLPVGTSTTAATMQLLTETQLELVFVENTSSESQSSELSKPS